MLYREIIAVCSHIHTVYINRLFRQNVELLNVKLLVHILTTRIWRLHPVACVVFCLPFLDTLMYTSGADDLYHYATQCHVTQRHTKPSAEQLKFTGMENGSAPIRHGRIRDTLSHIQHRITVQEQVQPVCKNEGIQVSTNKDRLINNHNNRLQWAVSLPRRVLL